MKKKETSQNGNDSHKSGFRKIVADILYGLSFDMSSDHHIFHHKEYDHMGSATAGDCHHRIVHLYVQVCALRRIHVNKE